MGGHRPPLQRRRAYAAWNGRARQNGRQHGATPDSEWPQMRGLRQIAESGEPVSRGKGSGSSLACRLRQEAREAAGGLVDGSRSSRGRDHCRPSTPTRRG